MNTLLASNYEFNISTTLLRDHILNGDLKMNENQMYRTLELDNGEFTTPVVIRQTKTNRAYLVCLIIDENGTMTDVTVIKVKIDEFVNHGNDIPPQGDDAEEFGELMNYIRTLTDVVSKNPQCQHWTWDFCPAFVGGDM